MPSPGDPILCNVESPDVNSTKPGNAELRAVVTGLRNEHVGGAGGTKAELPKGWLRGVIAEEEEEEEEDGKKGAGQ